MSLLFGGFIAGNKLALGEHLIPLPERVSRLVQDNQPITLGMRQEAVNISAVETLTNGVGLPAEVASFEPDYVHRTQMIQLRTGPWTYLALFPLEMNFQTGQRVRVQLDPDRLYFFDTNSGQRL